MTATVHQRQLPNLRHEFNDWRNLRNEHLVSFTEWLEQHVGVFGEDWSRHYDLRLDSPGYGTTWWFKNPHHATLTLLRWA